MTFRDTPAALTTLLLAAFALFVMYTRLRNWMDSNIPIMFYIAMIIYANAAEVPLPDWMIYSGFALGMFLRFEFMNAGFVKFVKYAELCVLGAIAWLCVGDVIQIY